MASELHRRSTPNRSPNGSTGRSAYVDNDGDVMMCSTSAYNSPMAKKQNNYNTRVSSPKSSSFTKRRRSSSANNNPLSMIIAVILFIGALLTFFITRSRYATLEKDLRLKKSEYHKARQEQSRKLMEHNREMRQVQQESKNLQQEQSRILAEQKEMDSEMEALQTELHTLKEKLDRKVGRKESPITGEMYDEKTLAKRETAIEKKLGFLQKRIQRESHRQLLELFGADPMKVEFEVELPEHLKKTVTTSKFVMEMAPIDKMPHSVHLFLMQLIHSLWDGCHFVVNAPHILQAGPYHAEHGKVSETQKKFKESGLNVLAFQEYHEDFPHTAYTVGFAGRPAGPDFYINLHDNSENHGPGGQVHHDLEEEADPCFAKIVEGKEVVDAIHQIPSRPPSNIMETYVRINTARILYPKNQPLEYDYRDYEEQYQKHQYKDAEYYEDKKPEEEGAPSEDIDTEDRTYHAEQIIKAGMKKDNLDALLEEQKEIQEPEYRTLDRTGRPIPAATAADEQRKDEQRKDEQKKDEQKKDGQKKDGQRRDEQRKVEWQQRPDARHRTGHVDEILTEEENAPRQGRARTGHVDEILTEAENQRSRSRARPRR